ncbi:DUF1722 domain-containing protein [bacterium]|nr:DUF1722 domain-containing protein [bacterium]
MSSALDRALQSCYQWRGIASPHRRQGPARETPRVLAVIDDYARGLVPLVVPVTLLRHYVELLDVPCVRDQAYLNPHPRELMLRNHV